MESVQYTHRTSFYVSIIHQFFSKRQQQQFYLSRFLRVRILYGAQWKCFISAPWSWSFHWEDRDWLNSSGQSHSGPRLVSNTTPRVVRYFVCLLELPHRLLAAFQKPKSQDWQVEAMSRFMILSWHSQSTISTIITNLSLIQREKNTDTTTPDIPQKQCPSHPVRRVCGMGDVTTSLKENEYYDSSLRVKKRVSKRLCDLPKVTQLKSNDTKILKQACVTPNPVKLPLHYTCKTCCWNSAMLQWKSGHM